MALYLDCIMEIENNYLGGGSHFVFGFGKMKIIF
jgi:hypothetical protein